MSALSGFVTGVLGLTLLEAVVSSNNATNNAAGLLGTATTVIRHLASPTTPGIPDLRPGGKIGGYIPPSDTPSSSTRPNSLKPGSRLPVAT